MVMLEVPKHPSDRVFFPVRSCRMTLGAKQKEVLTVASRLFENKTKIVYSQQKLIAKCKSKQANKRIVAIVKVSS